jgi:hypothetical protein
MEKLNTKENRERGQPDAGGLPVGKSEEAAVFARGRQRR